MKIAGIPIIVSPYAVLGLAIGLVLVAVGRWRL